MGPRSVVVLRRSRLLAAYLAALHVAALLALVPLDILSSWKAFAAASVAAMAVWNMYRWFRPGRRSAAVLGLSDDGHLLLTLRDGTEVRTRVLPETTVFGHLAVIHARAADSNRNHHVIVLADSCSAEEMRSVRMWLRWQADVNGGR